MEAGSKANVEIREVYTQLDVEWKRAVEEYEKRAGAEFPCGPGCSDCCRASDPAIPFVPPPMSRLEAEVLWEALDALPTQTKSLIVEREIGYHSTSCILLSPEGSCLVHEGRPLWCRFFGLLGMESCGKISMETVSAIPRWPEAVREAYQKLRGADNPLVLMHQVIRRLVYK